MVCRTLSVQEGAQGGSQRSSAWECTPGGLLSAFGSGRHPRWSVEHFQFRKAPKVVPKGLLLGNAPRVVY